ncbi:Ig-like domain-containing protein [Clostridium tagluense]|uniref:Ig-like domain-containing protein n=1 Tax=Clostridium tagluense TaxID=360422 RepID=UPI001C0BC4FC|nr:Ig-like domain-containing protein [Clostridium tagluense]MBU3127181.1 Ig-like domain-containing protein [Clostridium tagluense]MCB2312045.1 Ig-like domain-containing protein [Clostridium tagluense]MCB2316632.1 Ig-like domain-containing protein [Clostridium tagluense]MCB2321432.1 Ig-like domain-containing protein [Clostridium tagluense]MCB2326444.1 Ig-like domain-containing protein [Clostridium tagluense]
MNKKITGCALATLIIAGSTSFSAFASMSSGTVVIGNKAFDLAYANTPANIVEITNAIVAGGSVYIKNFEGKWINNEGGLKVEASAIPAVVYKNATKEIKFDAGDKDASGALEASYLATFNNATNAINNTSNVVYLTAADQYGKAYNIATDSSYKVTATINGMPLTTEVKLATENNMAKITIAKELVENDAVVIKVEKFDKDGGDKTAKLLASISSVYIVEKDGAVVPKSIAKVTPSVDSIVVGDAKVTLTADIRNQFNNPMSDAGKGKALVRWVVDAGMDLIDDNGVLGNESQSDNDTQLNKVEFTAIKPGTITISAYNIANGAKATYTVVVAPAKLTALRLTSENPTTQFNNENIKYNKIARNDGTVLTADMIKFNITPKTVNTVASDITVSAALRGGSGTDKNDILINAKTTKVGTYEVTPYVGTTFDAEGTIKSAKFDVATTLNSTATKIDAITLQKLKVDIKQVATLSIRNTYNEVIDVTSNNVTTVVYKDGIVSDKVIVEKLDKDGQLATTKAVKTLRFNAIAGGNYSVRVTVNGTTATYDIAALAELTTLKTIEFGNSVAQDIIANATEPVYRVISVKDNKGDEITPDIKDWSISTKNGANAIASFASLVYYKRDVRGLVVEATSMEAQGIAVKFVPNVAPINAYTTDTILTVTVGNKAISATDVIKDTLNVTVKAKSSVKNITLADSVVTIIPGATVKKELVLLDQYSKAITDPTMVTAMATDDTKVTAAVSFDAIAKKMYITYTGKKTGTDTVVLKAVADANVKLTVNVTIGDNTNISSIAFDANPYKVYNSTDDTKDQTVALTYKVNGGLIDIPASAISVIADSDLVTVTKSGSKIFVKAKANDAATGIGGSDAVVTISILTANGKTSSIFLTFSDDALVVDKSTVVIKDTVDENIDVAGVQLVIGKMETTKQIILIGKDQYGIEKEVQADTTWTSASEEVATVNSSGLVTAVKAGKTTVTGFYKGNLYTIEIEVIK